MSDERSRRVTLGFGLLAFATVVALMWLTRSDPLDRRAPSAASAPPPTTAAPPTASAPVSTASVPMPSAAPSIVPSAPPPPGSSLLASASHVRQALEQYQAFAAFPPWSRPADGSQTHLWKWNSPDAVGQAFATDAKGRKISAEMHLDKMFAGPGDSITATISVWRGTYDDATREPVDANVTGHIEVWRDLPAPGGYVAVAPVSFSNLAGGPGRRYVATFTPSTIAALKAAQVETRFVAMVDPDGHPFPFSETFRYAGTQPLVVLDKKSDAIVGGSLDVVLSMDIKRLGPVLVQATLFDATGTTPIATFDDYYRPNVVGPQDVRISFFGKTIADKKLDGPFSIRALHGFVRVPDADPAEIFWEHPTAFATGSYKATEFSSSDWESPEKTEKINQYKRMLSAIEGK